MTKILKYSIAATLLSVSALPVAVAHEPTKNPLSVHVLNLTTGAPSAGITVVLEKKNGDNWMKLNSAVTSQNGRISALYPTGQKIQPGDYRVTFKTGDYYAAQHEETFFPEIPVIFHIAKADEHYHVPLLLSPYGYSTYRGN